MSAPPMGRKRSFRAAAFVENGARLRANCAISPTATATRAPPSRARKSRRKRFAAWPNAPAPKFVTCRSTRRRRWFQVGNWNITALNWKAKPKRFTISRRRKFCRRRGEYSRKRWRISRRVMARFTTIALSSKKCRDLYRRSGRAKQTPRI